MFWPSQGLNPRFPELVQATFGRLAGESLPKERAFATWLRDVAGELIPTDRLAGGRFLWSDPLPAGKKLPGIPEPIALSLTHR